MSTMKRILAFLLAVMMVASMMSACGSKSGNTAAETETFDSGFAEEADDRRDINGLKLPLCKDKEELTVWLCYSGTVVSDLNEIEGVKKMEEITNVHINWIPVNQDDAVQKFGTLIASGDLPDIIYPVQYPGGEQAGVDDGVIYPDMDTLIREYMPNYMALLNSSEQAKREATSDSGKMLVCRTIVGQDGTAESEGTYMGLAYRADLLEKLGLDVPTTIEGWHDALTAAKNAGIPYPFVLDNDGGTALANAWGVGTQSLREFLQLDGDKIVCGQATENWHNYLDTMRQWYAEGLINPNFTTFHFFLDTMASVDKNETLLYSMALSGFCGDNYFRKHMVANAEEFLQPIVAPSAVPGVETIDCGDRKIAKGPIFISTSCKNPVLAAQWLDYQYTTEAEYLNWYGIEGETYTIGEDGTPVFTDLVLNNPDGMPPVDVLQHYALNQGTSYLGKHNISADMKLSSALSGGTNYQAEAVAIWSSPKTNVSVPESLTLTVEESDIFSTFTDIQTFIDKYTVAYITGQDVQPFEEYVSSLYAIGLQDVIDTYQAAYNRYLAR